MKVCIVLLTYNFFEYTKRCIDLNFQNAGIEFDMVVVDNGSKELFHDDRVSVLRLDKNVSYTEGMNSGIRWCGDRYDYILLSNNDVEPYENYLKILVEEMENDSSIAVASPAKVLQKEPYVVEYGAVDLVRGYHLRSYGDDKGNIDCVWTGFACPLIRFSALQYIGLLDRNLVQYCSDNDFCIRAKMLGYRVVIVTVAKVFHYQEITMKSLGASALADQERFMLKIKGKRLSDILDSIPINYETKLHGKLNFIEYKKNIKS